jgi:transposase
MAKYKHYNYSQTVLLPVSLANQLMPGTLEFAINTLVEERLDVSQFDKRYNNDDTGRSAYNPKVLLKAVLLAYSRGIIHSRKIEKACKENITFMALTCGQQPDHSTIAAFVSSMKDEIKGLFSNVLLVCEEMGLLGGSEFSLDGCKLPSDASKQWSGTFSVLKGKQQVIERRVQHLLEQQIEADRIEAETLPEEPNREKQITKLKKQAERIERFLHENEAKPGKQYKEVKSNITDNESAMMQTSHGVVQGYNAQVLVDSKHQVIVQAETFGSGQDYQLLEPVLSKAKENMQAIGQTEDYFKGATLTADTGYHSTESIKKCEDEEIDAYIPDRNFRKRDERFLSQQEYMKKQRKKFLLEDFRYDELTDQYECPNGKRLKLNCRKAKSCNTVYRRYRAEAHDCQGCQLWDKCIRNKRKNIKAKNLMVPVGAVGRNYSREMAKKIDTERGRRIYPRRIAIVEPVFANIRTQKRLDRFTLRGKIKVTIQWMLYCMVHNIEKIANYGHGFEAG